MLTSLKPISKLSNLFVISCFLFSTRTARAQLPPIGFYEGLLGNSGVALSDSTAASYYNSSLLCQKRKNSFSFGGNTLSSFTTTNSIAKVSSTKLSPSYISSVQAFENFVHEFFLVNLMSLQSRYLATEGFATTDFNLNKNVFIAGYSFAFHDFPMGFQLALRSIETNQFGFQIAQVGTQSITAQVETANKKIDFLVQLSGHHEFTNYNLGYKYVSRGLKLIENHEATTKNFVYDSSDQSYTVSTNQIQNDIQNRTGDFISIGHSFKIGSSEFLTDSNFEERDDLTHSYNWSQTFGYKVKSENQHQFLCGLSHLMNSQVKYFGQSVYFSVGYSWLTNANRSAVGMYYSADRTSNDTRSYGLTLSSEFIY